MTRRTHGFFPSLARLLRHRWHEDAQRTLGRALLRRLTDRVSASERLHSGEIRICIEGGLPASYIWRGATPRERAVAMFGKLRIWDTEHNNGVLIYLLLSERAIEIVADRGVSALVDEGRWRDIVDGMRGAFREGRYEDGLTQALEEVSALLVQHFPLQPGTVHRNELPNEPAVG